LSIPSLIADKLENPEKVAALLKMITADPGKVSHEDVTFENRPYRSASQLHL